MTKRDLWTILIGEDDSKINLADELKKTSFDEMLEIDLRTGQFRIVYHVNDKYAGIAPEGDFDRLFSYAVENFVHPEDREAYQALIDPKTLKERLDAARPSGALSGEARMKGVDGNWIWTRQLLISGKELDDTEWKVYVYIYDVQRQRQRVMGEEEKRETVPGRREEVTGLLEGMDFFRFIQLRLPEMDSGWCVIDIYIDHYKLFADWYGLESGRYLLSRVSQELQQAARTLGGYVGYMGQEEFCLVAPFDWEKINGVHAALQRIIAAASQLNGFSPIFGIAPIDQSSRQIIEYFNDAALTAEMMKDKSGARIRMYNAELHRQNSYEYKILSEFQHAIENGEITFYLQPQVRVSSGTIVGAESLARWRRSDGQWVSPAVFVPVLEKYGLVGQLDTFMWESVAAWLGQWRKRGMRMVPVSVNVSQIDIDAMDVPAFFSRLLDRYGLQVNDLKIEITESAYANDMGTVRETVNRLRKMGFAVLMDDFGSGYSSLNMLRNLNVDLIKLDAQFLRIQKGDQRKGISILESVVNMTKNLSTPIIVEGVEQESQVRFLREMGCSYMQGFYFFHPMTVKDFEQLISDEANIDRQGLIFKPNQQLRVREFLDENVFSDTMLNNVLGPVVFYNWHGDDVDIIRFNEQFYELVGIELRDFETRKVRIQEYMYPMDRQVFFQLLKEAEENWAVGARGVVRTYRPNGALVWLSLKLFFIDEDAQGKKYYASAQDVTEMQIINMDMPGAYYRCTLKDDFKFLYISRNFEKLTGYSAQEIRLLFDNRLGKMVHPDDLERLKMQCAAIEKGADEPLRPYRVRKKHGDYIYLADQSQVTDRFGEVCWQSIAIDVTEVMHLRNQMRLLSKYLASTVLFLSRTEEGLRYEVGIHGLSDLMGMDAETFQNSLNAGEFCRYVQGSQDIPHWQYTELFINQIRERQKEFRICLPNGKNLRLIARADAVTDAKSAVVYIVSLRNAE